MVRRSKRVAQRLRRRRRSGSNASTVTSLPPLRDNSADSQETEGGESPAQSPRGRSPSDYTQRTNGVWGRLPTTLRPVQPPRGATPSVEGRRRAHTGRPDESRGGESPAQSPRGGSPSDHTQRTNGVWGRLPTTLRPVQPPRGATPSVEGRRRAHTGRIDESRGHDSQAQSPSGRSPSDHTQRTYVGGRQPTTSQPIQPPRGATPSVEGRRRGRRGRPDPPPPQGGPQATGGQATFSLEDMAQVLAGMRPRDHFRAPVYCGEGDVELFLGQFHDVAVANRWGEQAALLHLRAHLEGTARACGAGSTRDRVEDALRARFGLSQRQAKDRLMNLKRDAKATLHEQAMDVQRLVDTAYPRLSRVDKEQMAMDHLMRALDNRASRDICSLLGPKQWLNSSRLLTSTWLSGEGMQDIRQFQQG